MLQRISIEGFKAIGRKVDVELGTVNVFIGANGCGKSSLLEAVGVLGAAAQGRVDDAALRQRGVRLGVPALYKSSFRDKRLRTFITLSALGGRKTSYTVGLDNPITNPEPAWRYRTESLKTNGKTIKDWSRGPWNKDSLPIDDFTGLVARGVGVKSFSADASDLVGALTKYVIYSPDTPTLRGLTPDLTQQTPVGLIGGRLPEALSETYNHCKGDQARIDAYFRFRRLIDWVGSTGWRISRPTKATVSPNVPTPAYTITFVDRYMRKNRNRLTSYDASEGALYVLFLTVLALHPEGPSIFAVDNFDQALNPRLARAVTRLFCDELVAAHPDRQVLLTTHNPLVLDGLDITDDRIRLFAVDRRKTGMAKVSRVEVDSDILQGDDAMTLSQLWIMGRLGGLPRSIF